MRKGLCFCLVLVLVLTMVWVPVSAEEAVAKIEIRTPDALPKAGEAFEVVAYISNNPGFCSIQFMLFAENDVFECTEIKVGEMLESMMYVANPEASKEAVLEATSVEVVKGDGNIATFAYVAKEDIDSFDFKIRDIVFDGENAKKLPYEIVGAAEVVAEQPLEEEDVSEPSSVTEHLYADATGHWAEWYINLATKKGLFKGNDAGMFNPDENVTRAQFVTVLWRMAGSPTVEDSVPFTDIDHQIDEFKAAIAWGYTMGYINGTSETTFDPDGSLTREAAMKMLHSYSGGKSGMEMMVAFVYDGHFEDSSSISSWAKPSVWWSVYHRLISGTTETTISPQNTATRAQLAKILVNYTSSTHIN